MKVFKLLILSLLALNILFGVVITIEYGKDYLVEYSLDLDNDESLEGELENEYEQDDENEKIVVLQSNYLTLDIVSSMYTSDEVVSYFVEKDNSPPPELFFS